MGCSTMLILLSLIILTQLSNDNLRSNIDHSRKYSFKQLRWVNENQIYIVQICHTIKNSWDDSSTRLNENERVLIYNVRTKNLEPIYNKDLKNKNQFFISKDGNIISCYDYEKTNFMIIQGNNIIKSPRLDNIISSLNINKNIDGRYVRMGNIISVDTNNIYFDLRYKSSIMLIRLNYREGRYYVVGKDNIHIEPNCYQEFTCPNSSAVIILNKNRTQIYIIEPPNYSPEKILAIQNGLKYFSNIGLIDDNLFYTGYISNTEASNDMFIYSLKTKKVSIFPKFNKSENLFPVYFGKTAVVMSKAIFEENSQVKYALYTYKGKLLLSKTFKFVKSEFPFIALSPSETKMAIWTLGGTIRIYDIKQHIK